MAPLEVKNAFLVWSPGFLKQLLSSLAVLLMLASAVSQTPSLMAALDNVEEALRLFLLETAHGLSWWAAVGALSSSCCVIQLALNVLSVGCSGLNTRLGPIRPWTLALCLILNAWAWSVALPRPWLFRQAAIASSLSFLQAMLPEFLHVLNRVRCLIRGGRVGGSGPGKSESGSEGSTAMSAATVILRVGGMGCSACLTAVVAATLEQAGVLKCDVSIEHGTARLEVSARDAGTLDEVVQGVVLDLTSRGYPSEVASIENSPDVKYDKNGEGAPERQGSSTSNGNPACSSEQEEKKKKGFTTSAKIQYSCFSEGLAVDGLLGLLSSSCCLLQLGLNALRWVREIMK